MAEASELIKSLLSAIERVRGERSAASYPQYRDAMRNVEDLLFEIVKRSFPDAARNISLEEGDFSQQTDAVVICKNGSHSTVWAIEWLPFVTRSISSASNRQDARWLRELWGKYQPMAAQGLVDNVLLVTLDPLTPRGAATLARYDLFTHVIATELDNFLSGLCVSMGRLEPVPPQSAGPHFTVSENGTIIVHRDSHADSSGNQYDRINTLLPLVRRSAEQLKASIRNTDAYTELNRTASEYLDEVTRDTKDISWGLMYGLGVLLDQATFAANRDIEDRLRPTLEDETVGALNSLLVLHGNLMLATADGRELQEQADRLSLSREEQNAIRRHTGELALELAANNAISEPGVARLLTDAGNSVGEGRFPERGSSFGIATVRNVGTVLVSAAFLAALIPSGIALGGYVGGAAAGGISWLAFETLKKSKVFLAATQALARGFDDLVEPSDHSISQLAQRLPEYVSFIRKNENLLRQIASKVPSMQWILPYLDEILHRESNTTVEARLTKDDGDNDKTSNGADNHI